MTIDHNGNNVPTPTETIKPVYQKTEQQYVAPVVQGLHQDIDNRKTYSLEESKNISATIREQPAGKK